MRRRAAAPSSSGRSGSIQCPRFGSWCPSCDRSSRASFGKRRKGWRPTSRSARLAVSRHGWMPRISRAQLFEEIAAAEIRNELAPAREDHHLRVAVAEEEGDQPLLIGLGDPPARVDWKAKRPTG